MAPIKVILLACGSFNPPTNMHLRMFEVARDNLNRLGQYLVIGGIISPVHDAYGKKDLAPSSYRCEMLKLALQSSDWIRVSNWECSQEAWSRTRQVLQYHQNLLNSVLNNETNDSQNANHMNANIDGYNTDSWLTNDIRNTQGPVHIKMLCGADLLQSFDVPGLWAEADIEAVVQHHGLVVVSRQGYDPYHIIYESDVLTRFQNNIVIINEWVTNDISSTKVRRALRRQESVKYLIGDSVIDFIRKHGLYGCHKNVVKYSYKSNINQSLSIPCLNDYILTPSPSDVNMRSVNSSGENIYLELNVIHDTSDQKKPFEGEKKKKVEDDSSKSKKVGFTDEILGNIAQRVKHSVSAPKISSESDEFRTPECSNISDDSTLSGNRTRKMSRRGSRTQAMSPEVKMRSDGDKCQNKSILMLRRSNSDAVMSRRTENGETASVKIQFTKDGIKVAVEESRKRTMREKSKMGNSSLKKYKTRSRLSRRTSTATYQTEKKRKAVRS